MTVGYVRLSECNKLRTGMKFCCRLYYYGQIFQPFLKQAWSFWAVILKSSNLVDRFPKPKVIGHGVHMANDSTFFDYVQLKSNQLASNKHFQLYVPICIYQLYHFPLRNTIRYNSFGVGLELCRDYQLPWLLWLKFLSISNLTHLEHGHICSASIHTCMNFPCLTKYEGLDPANEIREFTSEVFCIVKFSLRIPISL